MSERQLAVTADVRRTYARVASRRRVLRLLAVLVVATGGLPGVSHTAYAQNLPNLSVVNQSVPENAGFLVFSVTLSASPTIPVSVNYTTADVTATAGADYAAVSGTLTWTPGTAALTKTVSVSINDDALDEAAETFTLTLSNPSNANLPPNPTATGTIIDNDPLPSLSVNNASLSEANAGGATMDFVVTLSVLSGRQVTVDYTTSDGTATAGQDYTTSSGTLTWTPGSAAALLVSVTVADDVVDEDDETFTLTLSNASNAFLPNPATATGTITDDDEALVDLAVSTITVDEGAGNVIFALSVSTSSSSAVSVHYTTADATATAGQDYTVPYSGTEGTLTWAAGATVLTQEVSVTIDDDTVDEADETFIFTISDVSGGDVLGTMTSTTATIQDNDPSVSVDDMSVDEDAGSVVFSVSLNTSPAEQVKVDYATSDGTATAGEDYTAVSGTLTWAVGATGLTQTVSVTVADDALDEAAETFTLTLSNVENAFLPDPATATGTIDDDDDPPSVGTGNASAVENAGSVVFSVSLDAASGLAVTVGYTVSSESGDSATAGADYTATSSGSLTIAAGATSGTISVSITDDALDEDDETFTLTLTTATNASLPVVKTVVGRIDDDDPLPSLSVADASVTEADAAVSVGFVVTLGAVSGRDVSVGYATSSESGDTATADTDYTAVSGTLTWAAGATGLTQTVSVTVAGDDVDEAAETFTLTLSGASNASIGDATAVGRIDDDDDPSVGVADASVTEADAAVSVGFVVTLSASPAEQVTVGYATSSESGDTATADTDYTAVSGTLTWAAGATGLTQTVSVTVAGDDVDEAAETFTLTLSGASNASIGDATAVGRIDDDDDPSVGVADASVTEADAAVSVGFVVTLSASPAEQVTVGYATSSESGDTATADTDYTAVSGTLTWAAGATGLTQTVSVTVAGDDVDEAAETFTLTLSGASNASIGDATAVGRIDDDDDPSVGVADASVTEADAAVSVGFVVTLSASPAEQVTVGYATSSESGDTATADTDYTAVSGTLTWAAGATGLTQTVSVTVAGDDVDEAAETFTLTLSGASNASIGDATAVGRIDDDDDPSVGVADASVTEADAAVSVGFVVTLSASPAEQVTVGYATSSESGDTATADTDYTAVSGTLTWAAGATGLTQTVSVTVAGDDVDEAAETFTLTLSGASNASIGDATAVGRIDDDDDPSVGVADASVTEADAAVSVGFVVTLSASPAEQVTVGYATSSESGDTATADTDYTAVSGTLTWAAGATGLTQTVSVTVAGDDVDEAAETFTLTLSGASNASIGDATAVGRIDDDDDPSVGVADASVTEADAAVSVGFVVTLSASPAEQVTVGYATSSESGDTATADTDYTAVSGTLTWAAGATGLTQTVSVTVAGDDVDEAAETFTLTLSGASNASIGDATAVGRIDDDDDPSVGVADASVTEADAAVSVGFVVTLSASPAEQVTVGYATSSESGDTATADTDYTAVSGTLTWAAGATGLTQTVSVTVAGDDVDEAAETFTLTLSGASNASIGDATAVGRIDDDDDPSVGVADASVTEADAAVSVGFVVTLSASPAEQVTVGYATSSESGDSATADTDYTAVSGTLTWAAGATGLTQTVSVTVAGDDVDEAAETFTLTLSGASNASIGDATAVGRIDDDDDPSVGVADASVTEADAAVSVGFVVTLSASPAEQVTVGYATSSESGDSATADTDYTAVSGTLTWAAGATGLTQTVSVTVAGDDVDEAAETFTLTLSGASNASIGDATATGTIDDDDDPPSVGTGNASAVENAGSVVFSVSLDAASGLAVTVGYTVSSESGDSATAGADYTATSSGSLTIAAGATSGTISVSITDDALDEDDETFTLTLTTATNASLPVVKTVVGRIDDDDPLPSLSVADASVTEADAAVSVGFVVTLGAVSGRDVSVGYATSSESGDTATADTDYTAVSGTLTWAAGATGLTQTVSVTVAGDDVDEAAETFTLTLSGASNASIGDATAVGRIDDDDDPSVGVADASVTEADAAVSVGFVVTLSASPAEQVTVGYATSSESGDTATADTDYTAVSGTLTWAAGATGLTQTVSVTVAGDDVDEAAETFTLTLSGASNASIGDATAVGRIDDDDDPSVGVADASVTEADAAVSVGFVVTLSASPAEQVTVGYATSSESGDTATADTDYTAVSGTLTWAAGATGLTQTVSVTVAGDDVDEAAETFTLTLSGASNASIGDATAVGRIDDDDDPSVGVADASVTEADAAVSVGFVVTLSASPAEQVTVGYATSSESGDSATADTDYTAVSGTLTWAAGATGLTQTVSVTVAGDDVDEAAETFTLTLSGASNASIGDATAVGRIDDDDDPSVGVADASVTEADAAVSVGFVVTLSASPAEQVTVGYATSSESGDTATADTDYTAVSGTLTWAAGATGLTQTVSVTVAGDDVDEAAETFTLTLSGASNASIGDATAVGRIDDDDDPSVGVADASVTEADAAVSVGFVVTLSASPAEQVTVGYATSSESGDTATADTDYTAVSGTLTWAAGATGLTQTVSVTVAGDDVDEAAETFTLTLSGASNASIGDATAVGRIDDDDDPSVGVADASVTEADAAVSVGFVVTLSASPAEQVTVGYATSSESGDTATADTDYTAVSGTLTWAAGATGLTQTVSVTVAGDDVDEAAETFTLTLSGASNASIGDATAVGRIDDDDDPPSVGTGNASAVENAGSVVFSVSLDAASGLAVTVGYTTSSESGDTATADTDYTAVSGTLTWAAGATGLTQTVSVTVAGDDVDEAAETFTLTLSGASNASIGDATAVGRIDDDDDPSVGVADASVTEADAAVSVGFVVTLSASPAEQVTVGYATSSESGDTATADTDYTAVSGTLTWAAGATGLTQTVSVTVAGDDVDEAAETFTLTLSGASNASIGDATAVGRIDDDDDPSVGVADASVTEADAAVSVGFVVTLSASPAEQVTVGYATSSESGDSATADTDYTAVSGTLTWAAGATGLTQTVSVTVAGDDVDEAAETFTLTLSGASNASIGDATAVGRIDDDDDPSVGTGNASAVEGAGTLDFEVTLSASPAEQVTVGYATSSESGDTATAGTDYTATSSGSLTIAAGATSGTISVPINDDALEEDAETFTLTLTTATNASLPVALADKTAVGTIDDDDPSVGTGNASATEDEGSVDFSVSLNTSPAEQVTVNYTVGGGTATAGEDYRVPYEDTMGTLTIEVGEMRGTISVPINDDTVDEADETFTLTLMSAKNAFLAAEPADNTATGMIVDDDRTVTSSWFARECVAEGVAGLAVGVTSGEANAPGEGTGEVVSLLTARAVRVAEGAGWAVFSVTLGEAVEVAYATADGSAVAGEDYAATSGVLTIPDGNGTIFVPIVNDLLDEADETFTLTLSDPSNPLLVVATATVVIVDDDAPPSLRIGDASVAESAEALSFAVTLSAVSGRMVSVAYATSDGTATAGLDYVATSGTLVVPAGESAATILVPILRDAVGEVAETFTLALSGPTNAAVPTGPATATISDNDETVDGDGIVDGMAVLAIANAGAAEGGADVTFTVTLSAISGKEVSVGYGTVDGSAVAGEDYVAASGVLVIPAGESAATITVAVLDDTLDEDDETFTLALSDPTGATAPADPATAVIVDDDDPPALSVAGATEVEPGDDVEGGSVMFAVTLGAVSGRAVSVGYGTVDGSAVAGEDYVAASGVLVIPAGESAATITVSVLDDTLDEDDETFTLALSDPTGATAPADPATAVIVDDDDPPALRIHSVNVAEGGEDATRCDEVALVELHGGIVMFAVTLSTVSGRAVSVGYGTVDGSAVAGEDYVAASGVLVIPAGQSVATITVSVLGDTLDEDDETFTLALSDPTGATAPATSMTVVIVDGDDPPALSVADATTVENAAAVEPGDGAEGGVVMFAVTLSAVSGRAVSVGYGTVDGSAVAGEDYVAASGVLVIPAGESVATITVSVLGDTLDEDDETFTLTLRDPTNVTLATAAATATISDDDDPPALGVADATAVEPGDGAEGGVVMFAVALSAASGRAVSVGYGTVDATAVAGEDYVAASGVLVIPADARTATITVSVLGDTLDEDDETFTLTLSDPTNVTLATAAATATIVDDDDPPALSVADATTVENATAVEPGEAAGGGVVTFAVTLSAVSAKEVSVGYVTVDGSAVAGEDYVAASGVLVIPAGERTATITVVVFGDTFDEDDETFTLTLSDPTNATLTTTAATATISDEDPA